MNLTPFHWTGVIATVVSVIALGLYAGRRVKSAGDFLVAGRTMGPGLVAGSMLGTILGGSSTIGTVELAFKYGLSAIWWTFGSGIGCLILGLVMRKIPMDVRFPTVGGMIERSFGRRARTVASVLLAVSLYLSLIPNALSSFAVLSSVSTIPMGGLALVVVCSISGYVVLGGLWGTSIVGLLKIFLIAFSLVLCAAAAWMRLGSPARIAAELPAHPWLSLFGRGILVDLGSGIGITLGLLSSQMYWQAMAGAKSNGAARAGAFASALLAPSLGGLATFIGLSMRVTDPGIVASQALPLFVMNNLPPLAAGVAMGTFFIAAVGTAAGISLSVGSIITSDLLGCVDERGGGRARSPVARLAVTRGVVFAAILAGVTGGCLVKPSFILQFSIISMGIRTAAIAPALVAAVAFGPGLTPAAGMLSIIGGSISFVWALARLPGIDPVIPALAVSVSCLALAGRASRAGTSSRG